MGRCARCVVVAVLLLVVTGGAAAAESPFERPAAAERELLGERTPVSRTWELPSGQRVTQIASGPAQWRDKQGRWHDFDLSFEADGDGWRAQPGPVVVELPRSLGRSEDDAVRVVAESGDALTMTFLGKSAAGEMTDGVATYRGVADGVDIRLRAVPGGIKEDVILREPDSSRELRYRMTVGSGDLSLEESKDGGLRVVRGDEGVFRVPAPVLLEDGGRVPVFGRFEIEKSGDRAWVVTTVLPEKWLDDEKRRWPVMVDPTISTFDVEMVEQCNRATLYDPATRRPWYGGPLDFCDNGWATAGWVGKDSSIFSEWFEYWEWAVKFDTALTLDPTDAIDSATLKLHRHSNSVTPPIATDVRRIRVPWSFQTTGLPQSDYVDPVPYGQIPPGSVGPAEADVTTIVDAWRRNERDSATGFPNYGIQLNQALVDPYTGPRPYSCSNEPCPWTGFYSFGFLVDEESWPTIEVRSFPAAADGNEIITPREGQLTGRFVPLQARALSSSVSSVRFQYIAGSQRSWTDIPLSALRTPSRGSVGSVDIPVTGPSGDRESDLIVWDLTAMRGGDVDGAVHVRAWLESSTPGQGGMTEEINFRLDRRGVDKSPSVSIGPGELNLVSGEFTMTQVDASAEAFLQDLTLTRTYRSRGVAVRNADMFGAGWESSVDPDGGELPYKGVYNFSEVKEEVVDRQYLDPANWNWELFVETFDFEDLQAEVETFQEIERYGYEYAIVEAADGSKMTFTQVTNPRGEVTGWLPDDLHPGFSLERRSTGTAGIFEITVTDPGGSVAKFRSEAERSPSYRLTSFQQAGSPTALSYTYEAAGRRQRLKKVTAPNPTGGTPRSLVFTWGEVGTPRVARVTSVAFQEGTGTPVALASYAYDANGQLTEVTDPRIAGGVRKVRYAYGSNGRLVQVTPAGEETWGLSYMSTSGDSSPRLWHVFRSQPDGSTSHSMVDYSVPLEGSGAPYDMSVSETARWGQVDDLPWSAVAVYAEDGLFDYRARAFTRASVYYLGMNGLTVNVAQPGGGISTFEHDVNGNVIRELSAQGRAAALDAGASSATVAGQRSTLYGYRDGVVLTSTREPETQITLSDGRVVTGRRLTTTHYDEGAPGTGGPYYLPTRELRAVEVSGGADHDIHEKVRYSYDGEGGMSGWTARHPTKTIVDPRGRALTSYSILHGSYPLVEETRTPGQPGGGSGPDVQWHQYYGITPTRVPAGIQDAQCRAFPANGSGRLCMRSEATTGTAAVQRRWYTYSPFGHVATLNESRTLSQSGSTFRATTNTYDGADQLTSTAVSGGAGTATPTTTYTYDPATGRQTHVRSSAGTITRAFDWVGRLSSYTDAGGVTTTYRYDLRGRRTEMTVDGVTTTYGYDERDNPVSVDDPSVGEITATYDLDDQLAGEGMPNGLTTMQTFDETGRAALLSWTQTRDCSSDCVWVRSEITNRDADGRIVGQRTNTTQETLVYDSVGRLTRSDAVRLSDNRCVRSSYEFDGGGAGDSNRTSASTWTSRPGDACGTGTPTTRALTYGPADRISSSGWVWDEFGRATSVPAADSGGSGTLTAGYYTDDLVQSLSLDSRTHTYSRDPLRRTSSMVSSGASKPTASSLYHYSDDSDEPTRIDVGGRTIRYTTRNISSPSGDLVATDVGGTITYQLSDLQGSIVATAPETGTPTAATEYDPFGIVTTATANVIDNTNGLPANGWLGAHQRPTQFGQEAIGDGGPIEMGVRVYLPTVGRFLQPDPVDGGSWNAYDYAFQDPANSNDLSGAKVPAPKIPGWDWIHEKLQGAVGTVSRISTWGVKRCFSGFRSTIAGQLADAMRSKEHRRRMRKAGQVLRNTGPRAKGIFKIKRNQAIKSIKVVAKTVRSGTLFGIGVSCVFGDW